MAAALVLTAAVIALFDPPSALLAATAAGVALALPLMFRPWLAELDMRVRVHVGSLSQFYFDAMQGISAIKAHAAERVVEREQEAMLVDWLKSARQHLSVVVLLEATQLLTGFALAAWLLVRHVHELSDTGGALLLAYWALSLPELGGALATLTRQYPWQRNTLLRMLEPLGAAEETVSQSAVPSTQPVVPATSSGVAISFENVSVVASGHVILRDMTLDIAPGSHVAVVGTSGAGKSSLIGVLLGWHRAATGEVLIDRMPGGLLQVVGETGGQLSHGERSRLFLARALLQKADLVLLDESFAALDPETLSRTLPRVLELAPTLVVIAHP